MTAVMARTNGTYGIGTSSRMDAAMDPRSAPMLNTFAPTTRPTAP
jgi:hypothetical protein